MENKIWVVVADGFLGRLFRVEHHNAAEQFVEVTTMIHPEARLKGSERYSDGSGRGSDITYTSHAQKFDMERDEFARDIGDKLEQLRSKGDLKKFYLVAEPGFLGMLRKHLNRKLQHCLAGEIKHDFVEKDAKSIRKLLPGIL